MHATNTSAAPPGSLQQHGSAWQQCTETQAAVFPLERNNTWLHTMTQNTAAPGTSILWTHQGTPTQRRGATTLQHDAARTAAKINTKQFPYQLLEASRHRKVMFMEVTKGCKYCFICSWAFSSLPQTKAHRGYIEIGKNAGAGLGIGELGRKELQLWRAASC